MPNQPLGSPNRTLAAVPSGVGRLFHLPRIFRLVWVAAQGWSLAWTVLLVVQGILPAASVYLTRSVVDSLVVAMKTGAAGKSLPSLLVPVALMGGVLLLTELLQGALNWIRSVQAELLQDYISALIHQQAVAVDLAFYESPAYHDQLERARSDASTRCLTLLENSGNLMQNSITLLAIAAVLIPYGA
ncbi:MAG TPA: hypothetical protein V6D03_04695, partial [Candidatus Caenarcaniphilales bacterium]